jgi:cytochrome c-type biogenesis protein CcmH/NrfF
MRRPDVLSPDCRARTGVKQSARIMSKFAFVSMAMLIACVHAGAGLNLDPATQERVRAIGERVLAPCCWREAVSVHQSPTADLVREQIAEQVSAGKSDEEIVAALVRDHGKRILREPTGAQRHWLYWMPVLALASGSVLLVWFVRRSLA